MNRFQHIVIACSYLHVPGGYEKAIITTANLFSRKGWRVTLLVLDQSLETYFEVDKEVKLVQADLDFGITSKGNVFSRKLRFLKHLIQLNRELKSLAPDFLICAEYHFATAAVLCGAGKFTHIFSWEHHHYGSQIRNRFWEFLFQYAYRKLDTVVCLNLDEQAYYLSINKKTVVIPNFINPLATGIPVNHKAFDLISVTRFNHIKGIDLLMSTAKLLFAKKPGIRWKLIGYGEQKEELLAFIRTEGLGEKLIYQPANKQELSEDYRSASLFVMTSRHECFPLVLLEAMSHGLPCLSFDCNSGPRHIIQSGYNGLLTEPEQPEVLAKTILHLLDQPELLQYMSAQALKSSAAFTPDTIYKKWEALFISFVKDPLKK
jgi:glycosyltransferase involved in cell wall biosynthesis